MTSSMLRRLWSLVEATQATHLLNLDDSSLTQLLLRQFPTHCSLNPEETTILSSYIHSRLTLIRELAEHRTAAH